MHGRIHGLVLMTISFLGVSACGGGAAPASANTPPPVVTPPPVESPPNDTSLDWDQGEWDEEFWQ